MRKGWTQGSLESYKKTLACTIQEKKTKGISLRTRPETVFELLDSTETKVILEGTEKEIRKYLSLAEVHNDLFWKKAREHKQIQGYYIRLKGK